MGRRRASEGSGLLCRPGEGGDVGSIRVHPWIHGGFGKCEPLLTVHLCNGSRGSAPSCQMLGFESSVTSV